MKVMVKTLLTLLGAFTVLTSCMNSYNIEGSSNVPTLDGRMLFLKVYEGNDMKNIDSCDIVHGQFRFSGNVDSTRIATLLWMTRVLCLLYSKVVKFRSK